MSSELSQDLARWLSLLTATHNIVEVTRRIGSAREALQTVLTCLKEVDLEALDFKKAVEQLEANCLTKINQLCELSNPLAAQYQQVEMRLREAVASSEISTASIHEIQEQLRRSIQVSRDYERLLDQFQTDMVHVRELFGSLVSDSQRETAVASEEASNSRWAGCRRGVTTLASVAAILGLLGAVVAAPATVTVLGVAGCAAAVGLGTEAALSARSLDERARKFHDATKALQSSEAAFKSLAEQVTSGPVCLSRDLCESLAHLLQVHTLYHQKDKEAEQMKQAALMMAWSNDKIRLEREAALEEVRQLKEENDRLVRSQVLAGSSSNSTLTAGVSAAAEQ